jgi:glycosyltransferase involved in cell wall biosynthesis
MSKPKKICIASICNPLLDTRITNISCSLMEDGFDVTVIGFDWYLKGEERIEKNLKVFAIDRAAPSIIFYFRFVTTLFRHLLLTRADIYFAEDIQTLPIVSIIANIFNARVIYNSREIYAFIGGLRNKPAIQKIVTSVERFFIKKVSVVLTTGDMDSEFIQKYYNISNAVTVRNIPQYHKPSFVFDFRKKYNIADNKLIMLYQGIIVEGRGIVPTLEAMKELPDTFFILLGDGPRKENYLKLAQEYGVSDRVVFAGAYTQDQLNNYTAGADVGLTLIENISISYYHALPNKLFEYIMAELPVLSSNLPQMKKVVEDYNVGKVVNVENVQEIIDVLKKWCEDKNSLKEYRKNCEIASKELNWQIEYKRFKTGVADYLNIFSSSQ